jgi:long-chain acyl-CoA synthetase
MKGYYKREDATEEVIYIRPDGSNDRVFRTGDLGKIVDGKFLKVTGRIKEQFKLLNGKYVVPAVLEDQLCRSKYVSQALLYGTIKTTVWLLLFPT